MRKLWFLLASAGSLTAFGLTNIDTAPEAAADEWCFHGIYLDLLDGKAYPCPWGGGVVHTTHGDVSVNAGGLIVPDSAFAYGVPDDGGGDDSDDGGDDDSGD